MNTDVVQPKDVFYSPMRPVKPLFRLPYADVVNEVSGNVDEPEVHDSGAEDDAA